MVFALVNKFLSFLGFPHLPLFFPSHCFLTYFCGQPSFSYPLSIYFNQVLALSPKTLYWTTANYLLKAFSFLFETSYSPLPCLSVYLITFLKYESGDFDLCLKVLAVWGKVRPFLGLGSPRARPAAPEKAALCPLYWNPRLSRACDVWNASWLSCFAQTSSQCFKRSKLSTLNEIIF